MTLGDYVRLLRDRWVVVFAGLVLGLVVAGAVTVLSPPIYSAKTTMYVSARTAADISASAALDGGLLSVQRMKSYSELLTSTRIGQEVVRDLRLQISADEVARKIVANTQPETVILTATVSDTSAERAAQLANGVGAAFTRLVAELEQPTDPRLPPAVTVRVVEPALPPTAAVSPVPSLNLALGAVLGLLLGFGLAVFREKLDTSVKSPEQLREVLNVPGLGATSYDREVPDRPLTVYQEPHSPRAEAYRQLRTNLQFIDVDGARKVFVITSSLPGEGKTTTLCNLAIALADSGSKVLVIEADLRRPTAADHFSIDRAVGVTNVLTGKVTLDRAVKSWRGVLDVLPTGPIPPNPSELLASKQMAILLDELRARYDYILLDTPPLLLVTDAAAVAPRADGVILVCRYGKTSRNQVLASARSIEAVGVPLLGTVLSMSPKGPSPRQHDAYYSYYQGVGTLDRQTMVRPIDAMDRSPAPTSVGRPAAGARNGGPPTWPPSPAPRPGGPLDASAPGAGREWSGQRPPGSSGSRGDEPGS